MNTIRVGVVLYGLLFVVALPALLITWAVLTGEQVPLHVVHFVSGGILSCALGLLLIAWGMVSLRHYGKGLPMNPYPPPRYVREGAYRYLSHPIYVGFSLLCLGVSLFLGSASGLYLVVPVVVLGTVALVWGYERIDLQKRFGPDITQPLVHLPAADDGPPTVAERLSVYILVLLPWGILYEVMAGLGPARDAVTSFLPFENNLPVLEWTEPFYFSTYCFALVAPVLAPTRRVLRNFALQGAVATILMPLFFASIPLVAPPRPFTPAGPMGDLLALERSLDTAANAFPSYHVIWILLAMAVFAARMPRVRLLWWALAVAIVLSCMSTGMHSLVDVAGGLIVTIGLRNFSSIWEKLRQAAERIANSWKEWQWGSVRIINHGLYAGVGSFIAVAVVASFVGAQEILSVLLVASCALVTSALWAQLVEGSPSLLRPYGFYGGVLGIILGSLLALPLLGTDPWLLLASYSVAGPWVQSFGRLRCLVQGCCHGSPAPPMIGIVYHHPRSRVTRLAKLDGVPLHPTPLYSILWNVVIAVLLTRLWFAQAPLSMIGGLYLVLTGIGRFVEEAYRGEPQTRLISGLRFYQWIAIVTVIAGAVVTCIGTAPATGVLSFSALSLAVGALFGAVTWFALGVDFPGSNRRFARLV